MANAISILGAREHNLQNLTLTIPRNQFVVITGVSGSGKSTLAFDLLFAEGQRRFLDCMNAYARQFVEQLSRPDVDLITGIPPTVSIEQRISRGGGKSTVATVTEVYHFLRLLFARLGTQFCPHCHARVESQTRDQLGRRLKQELRRRGDLLLLGPVVKNRKGFHTEVAQWAASHGHAEVRADGRIHRTSEPLRLDRFREHNVEIVVGVLDRNAARAHKAKKSAQQLIDETLEIGHGTLLALGNDGKTSVHSTERACPRCGASFQPLDPKNFSYNSAQGWCSICRGFGELFYLPEVDRGARADAIEESWFEWQEGERELCPDCRGSRLNPIARSVRLELGRPSDNSIFGREHRDRGPTVVTVCEAPVEAALRYFASLRTRGREATIARDILPEIHKRLEFLCEVGLGYLQLGRAATTLSGGEAQRIRLAAQLGSNLSGVLYILDEPTIGLHARDNEQLLSALTSLKARGNSLVVVEHDEQTMRHADYIVDLGPGAGIHGGQLVAGGTMKELLRHKTSVTGQWLRRRKHFPSRGERRPVGPSGAANFRAGEQRTSNIEHRTPNVDHSVRSSNFDVRDSMFQEKWAVATGQESGGQVSKASQTQSDRTSIVHPIPTPCLILNGARRNNLKNLTVAFPLNRLVVVTGVSGSGKSTLIRECLVPALRAALAKHKSEHAHGTACGLKGHEAIQAIYEVDQSPIGRTPRSIPATYVGFFDDIRRLFSETPEARLRGYSPSRFSFNSPQGRCPTCEGAGTIKLEMSFMPAAYVRCETCNGTRYNRETLDIQYRGRNIAQVLELSVAEAIEFFASYQKIRRPLEALRDTGLDYLRLGQISPTLSGGEAQRLKLVTHLLSGFTGSFGRRRDVTRHSLFILEEPTIGLHMADVSRLVEVLQRLVDSGHSVIVIEHNLDLIAEADWVIDLGPAGGEAGGQVVAQGTPERIAGIKRSHTGHFLRTVLAN